MNSKLLSIVGALSITAFSAAQACEINARVSVVGNEFPAIQTVGAGAAACTGAEVSTNLTADHQKINVPGMQGNPAEYTSAIVANSSIVALMNEDVIRPLDDLVAKHGGDLQSSQLIKINGKIMAVAFMANAQHLMYRKDVLADLGISVPKTYEEMLAAAEKIRSSGKMQNPVGGAYAAGWNLAQEFNNMFLGYGGSHFEAGTANPSVNSEAGINALNMMKSLSEYMNPDFLTHDSNATSAEWKAGNVAMMNMWGSRMGPLMDPEQSTPTVVKTTTLGDPMTVGGGSTPATTLWWDGWTVAKNISDAEAEATFAALASALNAEMVAANNDDAIWLLEGFKPGAAAAGVSATAQGGAVPYPMLPQIGLLHNALGAELADFLKGDESAEKALADVEAAYITAAKEEGFLQ